MEDSCFFFFYLIDYPQLCFPPQKINMPSFGLLFHRRLFCLLCYKELFGKQAKHREKENIELEFSKNKITEVHDYIAVT